MSNALEKGIALGKAYRRKEALKYLTQALIENPKEIEAWMWISQLVDDRPTQKYCYKRILEIDPDHYMAKDFLGFLKDTDANLKFFPDPVSPLQTFFESQQEKQPQPQVEKSFPTSAPNLNIRPAIASAQNSHPAQPQSRPKKKGISPWISSYLVLFVLIIILSIIIPLVGVPLLPYYLQIQDPSIPSLGTNELALSGIMLGGITFLMLSTILFGLYWIASGYVGAFFLLKKGYVLELVGCSILAAGIPLLLPAVLGPIMYWWGNSLQEKNR